MPGAIRITYRHITGCLVGDCPTHAATIRTTEEVESVIRSLTERHSDFPIEIEGIEDVPALDERSRRGSRGDPSVGTGAARTIG
ncbi:MAG TPA: hypothetical protein VMH90_02720 [Thermoplasmata archaeon]|nr:hypothetical protein [Thermoplasmata archaeon]